MTTDNISVIICAYTEARWNDLVAAVASVEQQTLPPHEIIVVIDHNPQLLARAQHQFPHHSVIANHELRGLSGARNSGIAVARGAIIAFMDEDALAASDWLAHLTVGYADPQVVGVGGVIEPLWIGGEPRWFPPEFHWVVGCTYRGMPLTSTTVRNLIGCNMSLRRAVFGAVGGFRSGIGRVGTLPVGCEETELCIRAHQHAPHTTFMYQPAARVQHRVPPNRTTWRYFYARCYAEGISKAQVASFVGSGDGLASERAYTLRTLPLGVLRGIGATLRGDVWGLARAGAIIAGLGWTTVGYVRGTLAQRRTAWLQRSY